MHKGMQRQSVRQTGIHDLNPTVPTSLPKCEPQFKNF
ncbi:hypothetical protein Mucpa_3243 [Mucilaginibacter paludis DSM 18603]|uniref:Uncharacterized protein n=1 Tax=Mucilaginibacter paludis DSM 18603 TaxID=714943 RepID=H1YG83_9SPHI|nr:hypothetical protein Mucpa_3243 [Mucilaginibacter paludis DSM 18603]